MNSQAKLSQVVSYSQKRVTGSKVSLEDFITVDNLLPDKRGISLASNLPSLSATLPAYNPGNILVGNIRPYLKKIWFADKSGGASADVLIFDVKKEYSPKYVYYSMFRDDFFEHMMRGKKGTKMPRGDKNQILNFLIPDYEFPTQEKIAAALSSLDKKNELNNRINAELEAMAKTLYDYWFVQFDFPDTNGKPYKSSGGKMVWNEELKRDIPDGWSATTLGSISASTRGVTYDKSDVSTSSDANCIPILRATNISNSTIDLDGMVYVPKNLVSEDQFLNKFDILIVMSSGSKEHVGKNAFCYFNIEVSFGAFCSKISLKKEYTFYVNLFLHSAGFKKYIENVCLGTNINNLTNDHISDCVILSPSPEVLSNFESIIAPSFEKIGKNMLENRELAELRDWLLPMLMNGQVTVN